MENIEKCELYTCEHKGYTLQQTSKLTEEQAKEEIDLFIELLQKLEGGANG